MGYVHDTHMARYIPPTMFHYVTGTWSDAAGTVADTIVKKVNDANQTSKVNIPIHLRSNSVALKGSLLNSVEIDYEITGAALEEVTAVVNKVSRGIEGEAATVAAQTFTYDAGHDTAAERYAVAKHRMTLTITTPFYIDNDEYVLVELTVNQAGDTGVIEFLGAVANYTERL